MNSVAVSYLNPMVFLIELSFQTRALELNFARIRGVKGEIALALEDGLRLSGHVAIRERFADVENETPAP